MTFDRGERQCSVLAVELEIVSVEPGIPQANVDQRRKTNKRIVPRHERPHTVRAVPLRTMNMTLLGHVVGVRPRTMPENDGTNLRLHIVLVRAQHPLSMGASTASARRGLHDSDTRASINLGGVSNSDGVRVSRRNPPHVIRRPRISAHRIGWHPPASDIPVIGVMARQRLLSVNAHPDIPRPTCPAS